MAKAKAKGKTKAAAAVATGNGVKVGDRVRVLSGDWGNARGKVESISGGRAAVTLEGKAMMAQEFALSNLTHARGHFDR